MLEFKNVTWILWWLECLNIFFVSRFWELNPYSFHEKLRIQDYSTGSILLNLKMWSLIILGFKTARFLVSKYLTNRTVGILSYKVFKPNMAHEHVHKLKLVTKEWYITKSYAQWDIGTQIWRIVFRFLLTDDLFLPWEGNCTAVVPFSNSNSNKT